MQLQPLITRIGRTIELIEDTLLVLILALMITLAGGQILLRNVFEAGIAWGDPLLRLSVLWVGLLGAMVATRNNNYITIDVFYRYLPDRFKRVVRSLTDLFSAIICGVVAFYATHLVIIEKQAGGIAFNNIPAWLTELIIPIAFAVMACRFLVNTVHRFTGQQVKP